MQIVATMSFEQFRLAVRARQRQVARQNKRAYWLWVVFLILVSFGLTIAVQTPSEKLRDFLAGSLFGVLFLTALFFATCEWRSDKSLRKLYEKQQKNFNGQIMDIDASGIEGQWEDGNATYQYKWSAFESSIELPDSFLFFPDLASFVRIPKDSLSHDEQEMIRVWAAPAQGQ